QLGHPEIRPDREVGTLTLAEQQIVEIGRALAVGSRVLILDEPTSSITRRDADRLFELIERLRRQDHAIVYISHFIEECKRTAQRFTVLRDGRTVGGGALQDVGPAEIVDLMVGQRVAELYPRSKRQAGEEILSVQDAAGIAKPLSASFALRRGEVLGIAGLVGAGRTELLRTIFGLDPIRSGQVRIGAYVGPFSPVSAWARGVGLVSEDRKGEGLLLNRSVADNLTLSRLGGAIVPPSRQLAQAGRWIERLGIRCGGAGQRIGELSGGNQQKVALARLLHHDVDVLLLDEPTRGIDVGSKAQIYHLIDEIVSSPDRPRAVLMVSSYLPELLGTCDRIAVMCRGRLGPARAVSAVTEHQLTLEAAGESASGGGTAA
ncbi:MAG TPA: sugar ABC transporter ATP-binding protein, partial [Planctomycetota bacterium]|nr:sugar ABC transporter ATP-binding protein [Planctomycetota bacterium]